MPTPSEKIRSTVKQLIETGSCDIPEVTFAEVAQQVAKEEGFQEALYRAVNGKPWLLEMITTTAAARLVRRFS